MDRAHRIGQTRTVNVYRLVCEESVEEQIMKIQQKKVAVSDSIVNTDNSTVYSMGTDKLLDIFTTRSNPGISARSHPTVFDLDNLLDSDAGYENLGLKSFIRDFRKPSEQK